MKRKLVLKTEKLRVLTETGLDGVVGRGPTNTAFCLSVAENFCTTVQSMAAICANR